MLSKEEYLTHLDYGVKTCPAIYDAFKELIEEHFQLLEVLKECGWGELTPSGLRVVIKAGQHNAKQLNELRSNQPLKFQDLKEGMWVWDDRLKACFLIKAIKPNTHWNIVIYANYLTDTFEKIEFEEGRFYPLIKAMEGYKNG